MLLFRAHHDAFMYTRLCQERSAESEALIVLERERSCSSEVPVGKGSHIHRGTAAVSDQSATGHER